MDRTTKSLEKKEILSIKETCELLGISKSCLRNYTKKGLIKSYQISGKVLYKREEVLKSMIPIDY